MWATAWETVAALSGSDLWCVVLGPVRAWLGDVEVDLGAPQQRTIFGLLLVHAGRPVSVAEIVDAIWPGQPPAGAVNAVHRSVGLLRRALEPGLPLRDPGNWLVRSAGGYRLAVDAGTADLPRFRDLLEQARVASASGAAEATDLYVRALDLWQGWSAGGVSVDLRTHPSVIAIHREYLTGARAAGDHALAAGTSELLLGPVELAAAHNPLDEPLHARLVRMLAATGRQAEALQAYHRVRDRLVEDLGLDPGTELAAARDAVLQPGPPVPEPAVRAKVRPLQLPADLPTFTGRQTELGRVLELPVGAPETTVVVSAIGGTAGIGKTTFAVHWAHQIADRFPDGQLYLNLRGFEPTDPVMSPSEALVTLLDTLDTPAAQIPAHLDAQAALYRSVLAGQRLLILLDNARDADQVRPLLPGSSGCLVIITSRNQLWELNVTHGARLLTLDFLPAAEARDFLGRRIGAARLAAEAAAGQDIIDFCGGLPLALAIVAARATVYPTFPLAAFATELRQAHGSLDAFAGPTAAVNARAVFSWSYQALTPPAADLFRLLSVHPGPDIDVPAAASLAGVSTGDARAALAELHRAHLVTERVPGRYTCHDLLRAFATERLDEDPSARAAARLRLIDHYLHSGWHARIRSSPSTSSISPPPIQDGVTPEEFADKAQATAWFAAQMPALVNLMNAAQYWDVDTQLWQLLWTMSMYIGDQASHSVSVGLHEIAVEAARRSGDRTAYARCLNGLAMAVGEIGQPTRADQLMRQALDIVTESGDKAEQARLHVSMVLGRELDDPAEALHHANEALSIYQALGHQFGTIQARLAQAKAHLLARDHQVAIDQARQTMTMIAEQRLDLPFADATLWEVITRAHLALGDLAEAVAACRASLDIARRSGLRQAEYIYHDLLGDLLREAGDTVEARASWRQAIDVLEDSGGSPVVATIRAKLDTAG